MTNPAAQTPGQIGAESIPSNETTAITELTTLQLGISKHQDPHHRGQHPKAHGCVEAQFRVLADIPAELKVGVFAEARTWPALVRFSNGKAHDDRMPDVHGMAIKVLGVDGSRAVAGDQSGDQDFILIDSETFFADTPERLLGFMRASVDSGRAGTPDAIQAYAASDPGNLATVQRARQSLRPAGDSPLVNRYWSTVPYRCGPGRGHHDRRPGIRYPGAQLRLRGRHLHALACPGGASAVGRHQPRPSSRL